MKIADVQLTWTPSVTPNTTQRIEVTTPAGVAKADVEPGHSEYVVKIPANTAYSFKVITISAEGVETPSLLFSQTLGDLESPQPATDLAAKVIAVNDVPDA